MKEPLPNLHWSKPLHYEALPDSPFRDIGKDLAAETVMVHILESQGKEPNPSRWINLSRVSFPL